MGLSTAVALGSSLCGACCRSCSPYGRNSSSALRVALVASLIFAIGSRLALGWSLCVARGRSGSRKRGTPPACLASLLSPRSVLRWSFASAGSRARRSRVATSPSQLRYSSAVAPLRSALASWSPCCRPGWSLGRIYRAGHSPAGPRRENLENPFFFSTIAE